ncbi:peptidoglycan-associated lipoprotein Pal [Caulobacter sp. 17J80-11]|uniref:peptidoglycan-associated lipoprotein Pal n=1 Tax=Caulobacter sp. 17J80-11 TaxID=2763502 RepID=UPI001653EBB4|nr:peptidoglycan-associated lipoprotein Pal [Caulobacter sp. 17J80-11]MBC6982531.1 peptidoglycan-associated lipoprotein Pal [Caulobacter sp. 17J80-11]
MRTMNLAAVASMVLLAACATKPKPHPGTVTGGETPAEQGYNPGAGGESVQPGALGSLAERFASEAGDRVYFELDSHTLGEDAMSVLRSQANWLAAHPNVRVMVAGNADERGTREYNFALGARRATAVKTQLVAWGIAPNRIDTISYGKERPIASGSGEDSWAQNRNAQSVVLEFGDRR